MTDWGFPNFDRHLDPDLYDPLPEGDMRHSPPAPKCRGCSSVAGPFNYFNGWPWCRETCYREISALYMGQPHPVTAEEAEEHFRQRRRI